MASITANRIDGTDFISAVPSREVDFLAPWFTPDGYRNLGTGAYLATMPSWSGVADNPFSTVSADGVETQFVATTDVTGYNLYFKDGFWAWIDPTTNAFWYHKDGTTHTIARPTVANRTPYELAISDDLQYAFWGSHGTGDLSIFRCELATEVVTTIKTWSASVVDQVSVEWISADNSVLFGLYGYLMFSGNVAEKNTPFTMTMDGTVTFLADVLSGTYRGHRSSRRFAGYQQKPTPAMSVVYSPETGLIPYTNTALNGLYPRWSNNGLYGVTSNATHLLKVTGLMNSEVVTPYTLPDDWLPYTCDIISDDGNVVWGTVRKLATTGYVMYEYKIFRFNFTTNAIDTFGQMENANVWYTSYDGSVAVGDFGSGLCYFSNGTPPVPYANSVVAFEETFSGGAVFDENGTNISGLGWLENYVAADGGQWLEQYGNTEIYGLTATGLLGIGWFDYVYRTIPVVGPDVRKYFAEIDFRYEGGVNQAVGLFIGQDQTSIDLGNWNYDNPLIAISLGMDAMTDFWFEVGYDGDGISNGTSDTAYGAAAGSGIATLRIELLDEFAMFLLNGQLLHIGMLRQTPQGPFFGLHASDMGVITAVRYGFEATPQPDFWQDFVITKELP